MPNAMIKYKLFFAFLLVAITGFGQQYYHKEFNADNTLVAAGWMNNGLKVGYWKFYYVNGNIKEAGHYKLGQKDAYWFFYNENGTLLQEGHYKKGKKTNWWKFYTDGATYTAAEYEEDLKNGFCIFYKGNTAYKCEKYAHGQKIKEWTDIKSFKRDNKGYFFL
jgi:antitoxin component YwqK of YwqJK toxin-antitoxin module